jgi:hypothetical protein
VKTPVAEGTSVVGTAVTAETIVLAGALERSTAVRTIVAAKTPEKAEKITTDGAQATPTAEITSAIAESTATAEVT